MRFDDLNVFHHVVTHGTFTAAAKALGRPKSSVSAAVARLEAFLGLRLLERTTRRIRLTEAGTHLHDESAEHVDVLHDILVSVQSQSRAISGTLRLAAPYEFGAHHLAEVSARLMAEHPALRIVLDVDHRPVDLFERNYDIVFSMTDLDLSDSSIVGKRVFSLHRGVFASPKLLQQYGEPATPDDLSRMPLLCGINEKSWKFIDPETDESWFEMDVDQPRLVSSNASVRKLAMLNGLGVARLTSTFCEKERMDGQLKPLLPGYVCQPLTVYALMPARRLTLPKVRLFLDTLVSNTIT
ncbi:MAG TPA: LysR family transcriptional regulator [Woeseiaceae bacterium]|nr:LysR family transcriptional regulator [Woeseiaceae bacterium]